MTRYIIAMTWHVLYTLIWSSRCPVWPACHVQAEITFVSMVIYHTKARPSLIFTSRQRITHKYIYSEFRCKILTYRIYMRVSNYDTYKCWKIMSIGSRFCWSQIKPSFISLPPLQYERYIYIHPSFSQLCTECGRNNSYFYFTFFLLFKRG